ncbi:UDP-glucose:undecaprenyl-phosphate glucose-1-phosphate transferase [Posidoniimonas corsicana]|uniref:UDP-glucose:undecaprenyl-phosphate glucose-1-phosphate transferase n=1 Tax=Posidoniimonas corsicana TaxID=1938618 RepID=A0A5C5V7I9_9BACT|nr:sugar transferase [Posidoniimonas corsicana]TWT33787.1 UDP-glucose:undecaprenyl-phosphate glucose-1-phosphate transferase [Posidoniimonas corsicana]
MSATTEAVTLSAVREGEACSKEVCATPYALRKRPFVRVIGVVIGVPLAPIVLLLVLLVRLTSSGPGLYRQRRVGLHGEEFTIYKIRSMRQDAETLSGPVWAAKKDARVTPLGRFLRYSHLDELPQILNVIRGDMDFVGPRPERPEIVEDLVPLVDGYQNRHVVLPGITGLAQVNLEPDQEIECVRKKVAADLHYIENASLYYDLRLLSATILRVLGLRYQHGARLLRVTLPRSIRGGAQQPNKCQPAEVSRPDMLDDTVAVQALCDTIVDRSLGSLIDDEIAARSEVRVPR